jgi:GntR family transcriptional regulator
VDFKAGVLFMTTETSGIPLAPIKSARTTLTSATADAIRNAIQEGTFPPGSQLPPELELMNMLGVSRTTLREALRSLDEQGFIERRRGLGTFVREQSILKDLSINFGISEMIRQAGLTPGSIEEVVRHEKASKTVAEALDIDENAPVVVLDRVRTANFRPVVWSLDILPASLLGEHSIKMLKLEVQSLYQYLDEQLDIHISRGVAQLYPVSAKPEMAAKLQIRTGTPLLCAVQTDYDNENRPVLYSVEHHLPDAFVFLVNRRGPHW